jgi:hypothetical protein
VELAGDEVIKRFELERGLMLKRPCMGCCQFLLFI